MVHNVSMSRRCLVQGVGTNDADYVTVVKDGGSIKICPFYQRWKSMLHRAYSASYHKKRPSYRDVTVCDVWLTFSAFKDWMVTQDWVGLELDKDVRVPGNLVYGPDTCVFVDGSVNRLLNTNARRGGDSPTGVSFISSEGKYRAQGQTGSGLKTIGRYTTEADALLAYNRFKKSRILDVADKQTDPRVVEGLRKHAALLRGTPE